MLTEKQVEIASKLYQSRRSAKGLYGDRYQEKLKPYREAIAEFMVDHREDVLPSTMALLKRLQELDRNTGVAQMLLLAACVEMCES